MVTGVIPLGIAVKASGTADVLADFAVARGVLLPGIVVLGLFYLETAVITEMVSNSAPLSYSDRGNSVPGRSYNRRRSHR